jgi:hypothetical protein
LTLAFSYLPQKSFGFFVPLSPEGVKERMISRLNADYGTARLFKTTKGFIKCRFTSDEGFTIWELYQTGRSGIRITGEGSLCGSSGAETHISIRYRIVNGLLEVGFLYFWIAFAGCLWLKMIWENIVAGAFFVNLFGLLFMGLFPAFGFLLLRIYRSYIDRLHKKVVKAIMEAPL